MLGAPEPVDLSRLYSSAQVANGYLPPANGAKIDSTQAPRSEALFQVKLPLPEPGQDPSSAALIEVGIQEQWHDHAASPGQVWAGYRIVAISDTDAERLHGWLDRN